MGPTGAASRSALVWRRWRAALPPHRLPIMRRRLISIIHPDTDRWHPPSRGISYGTQLGTAKLLPVVNAPKGAPE